MPANWFDSLNPAEPDDERLLRLIMEVRRSGLVDVSEFSETDVRFVLASLYDPNGPIDAEMLRTELKRCAAQRADIVSDNPDWAGERDGSARATAATQLVPWSLRAKDGVLVHERRKRGGNTAKIQRKLDAENNRNRINHAASELLKAGVLPAQVPGLLKARGVASAPTIRTSLASHPAGHWPPSSKKTR